MYTLCAVNIAVAAKLIAVMTSNKNRFIYFYICFFLFQAKFSYFTTCNSFEVILSPPRATT